MGYVTYMVYGKGTGTGAGDEMMAAIRRSYPSLTSSEIHRIECPLPFMPPLIPNDLPRDFRITLIVGPSGRFVVLHTFISSLLSFSFF
jgi:hypothetical protein